MRLKLTSVGNDKYGHPIFEVRGERYFYVDEGKRNGNGADHVWSSARGSQLIFRGPDYELLEWCPPIAARGNL